MLLIFAIQEGALLKEKKVFMSIGVLHGCVSVGSPETGITVVSFRVGIGN